MLRKATQSECVSLGKYHDLERQLVQEFTAAQRRGEIGRMREVAAVLLHFKVTHKHWTVLICLHIKERLVLLFERCMCSSSAYCNLQICTCISFSVYATMHPVCSLEMLDCGSDAGVIVTCLCFLQGYAHCVDVYIKQCQEVSVQCSVENEPFHNSIEYLCASVVVSPQVVVLRSVIYSVCVQGAYMRSDVFEDTALLCQRVNKQVGEVFQSPETVMAKLIQNIFENKLQV